jgi:hypothetical protein
MIRHQMSAFGGKADTASLNAARVSLWRFQSYGLFVFYYFDDHVLAPWAFKGAHIMIV